MGGATVKVKGGVVSRGSDVVIEGGGGVEGVVTGGKVGGGVVTGGKVRGGNV